LEVGIGDNELDALDTLFDHSVDRISAAAADTDNLDTGSRDRWLIDKHLDSAVVHL
jgi:hypothetical protein